MPDTKHIVHIAASGGRGSAKLYASWCRCGWSTPLVSVGFAKSKAQDHVREVGGGEIRDNS